MATVIISPKTSIPKVQPLLGCQRNVGAARRDSGKQDIKEQSARALMSRVAQAAALAVQLAAGSDKEVSTNACNLRRLRWGTERRVVRLLAHPNGDPLALPLRS